MFVRLSHRRTVLGLLVLLLTAGGPLMATDELWVPPVSPASPLSPMSQQNDGQTRFSFTVPQR